MIGSLVALGGSMVGAVQAGLLARSTLKASQPLGFFLRLLLIGGMLVFAAAAGQLLAAAIGWLLGFAAGVLLIYRRQR